MINVNKVGRGRLGLWPGLLAVGLLALTGGGCGLSKRAYPEKRYYNLGTEFSEPAQPPLQRGLLLMGEVRASSPLNRPNLIYKIGENEFQSDFYHEFVAPIGRLWREALAVYLDDRGPVSDVGLVSSFKMPDWMLEGFLITQYADLTGPWPQAVVSLKLTVTGLKSAGRPIIFTKVYDRRQDLADKGPQAFVQSLNLVMSDIFREFNRDLRQVSWTK